MADKDNERAETMELKPKSGEIADDDDYDPHLHRKQENATTNIETLIHLLKGCLGTGILAMPKAFKQAGLTVGTVGCLLIGLICTYCLHVLVRSQYIMCKRLKVPLLTYPESMKIALEQGPEKLRWMASLAGPTVDFFIVIYQLGICCVYVVFIGDNLKKLSDTYWIEMDSWIWMLIVLVPLIAINMIRNLRLLAPFSQVANLITFIGLGIIYYFVFTDFPSPASVAQIGNIGDWPLYFGTVLFALEAVGVIIALENNMKTPKDFGGTFGVLNVGMGSITILYAFTGFVGLVKYGDAIEDTITLNLGTGTVANIVVALITIAIFISYALQCYVPVDIMWNTYIKKKLTKNFLLWEYVMRIVVVVGTFKLAVAIPRLGLFISLFGALCLSVLGLVFPPLMEICVLWPNVSAMVIWKNIGFMIFGFVGFAVGTGVALHDIIVSFQ